MARVLITDKINQKAVDIVEKVAEVDNLPTMSEDELVKNIGKYDAILIRSETKLTKKVLDAAKNMKIIARAGVGVDNIDLDAATANGIIVVNSPDGNTIAAAEHTIAMMLSMVRNIADANESIKKGEWARSQYTGIEVFNKTLGVIGFGKIGQHVAKVAVALGMKVLVYDPFSSRETVERFGATYVEKLDDLWPQCDFITVHTPKTKETANMINKDTISKMKKGVRIINCARGGIVNEKDLESALNSGQVAGIAIDVFEDEKNIKDCVLLKCGKNATLTPHLGASTSEAQINVAIDVAQQVAEVLTGGNASSAVNIPSLKNEKLEPVKEYMGLAENIASFAQQISDGSLKSIEIEVRGELANVDISPLETAILKGVLSSHLDGINYVNAPFIAKQRGIDVSVKKSQKSVDYIGSIRVKLSCEKEDANVAGALILEDVQRIVKINDYNLSVEPAPHMLLVPHENKPSMIAKVATVLGNDNVNISKMEVAQKKPEKEDGISIMIINTDNSVSEDTLKKISDIEGIQGAKQVALNLQ